MKQYLKIELLNYWRSGTGQSRGMNLDALTNKTTEGLPKLGGKHIKGLLRDALRAAEAWKHLDDVFPADFDGPCGDLETLICGSRSQVDSSLDTLPGMLVTGDALLHPVEGEWLLGNKDYIPSLYEALFSTAIGENGSAKNKSLRGFEVSLPVNLFVLLELNVTGQQDDHKQQQLSFLNYLSQRDILEKQKQQGGDAELNAWSWLQRILPLMDSVGADRQRGSGEAIVTILSSDEFDQYGVALLKNNTEVTGS